MSVCSRKTEGTFTDSSSKIRNSKKQTYPLTLVDFGGLVPESLDEVSSTRPRHGAQVGDELILGHAQPGIPDGEGGRLLVVLDPDLQIGIAFQNLGLGDGQEAGLVEGIGRVGNQPSGKKEEREGIRKHRKRKEGSRRGVRTERWSEEQKKDPSQAARRGREQNSLPQKDILVGVEGVDDNIQHSVDLGLKLEVFRVRGGGVVARRRSTVRYRRGILGADAGS